MYGSQIVDLRTRLFFFLEANRRERESQRRRRREIRRSTCEMHGCSPVRVHQTLETVRPSVSVDVVEVFVVLEREKERRREKKGDGRVVRQTIDLEQRGSLCFCTHVNLTRQILLRKLQHRSVLETNQKKSSRVNSALFLPSSPSTLPLFVSLNNKKTTHAISLQVPSPLSHCIAPPLKLTSYPHSFSSLGSNHLVSALLVLGLARRTGTRGKEALELRAWWRRGRWESRQEMPWLRDFCLWEGERRKDGERGWGGEE